MRALLLALAGLAALAPAARAQAAPAGPDAPPPLIEAVEVGLDKGVADRVPAPVWVTLQNRRDRELELRVVARSQTVTADEPVVLPPGARKRVALALAIDDELLVEVVLDGATIEQRVVRDLATVDPTRHVLVLDGRPPERRTAGQTRRDEQVLLQTTIDAGDAPVEPACYAACGAVLIREADPSAWREDQRQALIEHVRLGGLLLLSPAGPKNPEAGRLFEALAGPVERAKVVGRPARAKRFGLGRVIAWDEDVIQAAWASDAASADLKQRLGALVAEGHASHTWPRAVDDVVLQPFEGPGTRTRTLVVGFVLLYLLAVGPILAIALRRASRPRLAAATAGLIAAFSLLAPVVAGVVRTGAGTAYLRTVLYVPPAGEPFETGQVTVISGGATRYEVAIEGAPVAASVVLSTTGGEWGWSPSGRWEQLSLCPAAVRTRRGERVEVEVGMPPWGTQRIDLQGARPDVRPLQSALRRVEGGVEVTLVNTTGGPLLGCMIVEDGAAANAYMPYAPVGDLAPGERRVVLVPRPLQNRRPPWHEVADAPEDWTVWLGVTPARAQGEVVTTARYRLVSRARSPLRVTGPNLVVESHALRLDPLAMAGATAHGYLGCAVEQVPGQPDRMRVARIDPGSPFAGLGLPVGTVLLSIDGVAIASPSHFRTLIGRHLPGEGITLEVWDGQTVASTRVTLAARPGSE